MSQKTAIEWCDATFNPWQGCVKVSPACRNCYAATLGKRFGVEWGPKARRKFQSESYWAQPLKWNAQAERAGARRRVFCASMADVFEMLPEGHPDAAQMKRERCKLWLTIQDTPHLDWLLLTKRPENVTRLWLPRWREGAPLNVWVGTTVENQEQADKRIPHLLEVPATVRFLSCEPLLGPLDLSRYLGGGYVTIPRGGGKPMPANVPLKDLHWVIAGGESGPGARPSDPDWFRSLRDQCQAASVAFHFKQWGEFGPVLTKPYPVTLVPGGEVIGMGRIGKKAAGRVLDGRTWDQFPEAQP